MLSLQTNRFKPAVLLLIAGFGINCFLCNADDSSKYSVNYQSNQIKFTKSTNFGGVELNLVAQEAARSDFNYPASLNPNQSKQLELKPEISLFTSEKPSKMSLNSFNNAEGGNSNRYKNTIPAVYRVTLKGYSIMEYSNNVAQTWSLDKVKDQAISKPTIMFSFTKEF